MKLFRNKKRWTDDTQKFHMVENAEWKEQQGWAETLLNFHILTFCGIKKILAKGDDYVQFDRKLHTKLICKDCYKMFQLSRKVR